MKTKPAPFAFAAILGLLSTAVASAQDIQKNVVYVCNGERLVIDSCNMRDLSDTSSCMVGHPDTVLPNGLMKYTNETRGALKKLLPTCKQPSADQIARAKAFEKKQQDLYDANVKKANKENDAIEARAQEVITGKKAQTPEQRALNRCITSGRLPATCEGNVLMKPFEAIIGSVAPSIGGALPPGPYLRGNFEGQGKWRIEFDDRFSMTTCGGLDPAQENYSIVLKNNTVTVTIPSKPKDVFLTMKPDGTLVGPGPITMYGIITTGYKTDTYGSTTTHTTEYREATRVCPLPVLSSKGAVPSGVDIGTGFLKSMFSNGEKGPPTPAGLRMHGSYGGDGGVLLEFYPESAVISCGEAAHAYPYVVQVSGTQPVIKLEDPAHPLLLTMKPDGELDSGSGSYEVPGRTITGRNDAGFTFAPLNATCTLGSLKPGATPGRAPAATTASAPPTNGNPNSPAISSPSAPTGNAILTITSGFPAQPGVPNPLAGRTYVILRDEYTTALKKGGIAIPPGMTGPKFVANACGNRTPDCPKALAAIKADAASAIRADNNGNAALPGVPPGTYYPMIASQSNKQNLSWGFKVDLKAGANSITLDQHNAATIN